MPLLSVIVPVYKVEKYIKRCVDSILNQSYKDFELILVDDGSPDNCGKICDEYELIDKRIIVVHKKNGGLSDARNAGIEIMKGQYVTFIDSDDFIHKETFSTLMENIEKENADISICSFLRTSDNVFETSISKDYTIYSGKESVIQMYVNPESICFITAWGKIYKSSLFKNIRYPKGKLHEDEFTTYKLLYSSKRVVFTNNKFYFYYINPESIIQSLISERNLDSLEAMVERTAFFEALNETQLANYTKLSIVSNISYSYQRLSREKKSKNSKELKKRYLSYLDKSFEKDYISSKKGIQKIWAKLFFISPDLFSFIRNFLKIGL